MATFHIFVSNEAHNGPHLGPVIVVLEKVLLNICLCGMSFLAF